jgi:hypothetical protein
MVANTFNIELIMTLDSFAEGKSIDIMGCLAVHETTVEKPWLLECFKTQREVLLLECFKTQREVLFTRWRAQSGGKSGSIWSSSRREVLQKANGLAKVVSKCN